MKWTYRSEYVKCGKAACNSCPHGPYWYRYRKVAGKTQKEYVGKEIPKWWRAAPEEPQAASRFDAIHNRSTASVSLACEILGLSPNVSFETAKATARKLLMENHPDRGGDNKRYCHINSAWSYLKYIKGWN